jgi:uncharacterized membrane protein
MAQEVRGPKTEVSVQELSHLLTSDRSLLAPSLKRALVVWLAIVAGALGWLGLIAGAPLFEARGHHFWAQAIYRAFSPVCHQMPERSFYLAGHPLAVCARCCGLYAGFAASTLLYPLVRSLRRRDAPARRWLFLALAPTAVDFGLNLAGVWENTHASRALTGALLGAVIAFYVVPGLIDLGLTDWRCLFARSAS